MAFVYRLFQKQQQQQQQDSSSRNISKDTDFTCSSDNVLKKHQAQSCPRLCPKHLL